MEILSLTSIYIQFQRQVDVSHQQQLSQVKMKLTPSVSSQLVALLTILTPLASSCSEKCQDEHSWDNLDHFSEFGLVGSLLPCQPKHTATIFHNADDYVLVGNELTKEQVKNQPEIDLPSFIRRTNYTAMLIDVDAPSRDNPELSPYLHFLAVNSFEVIIGTSDIVVPYQSPSPPPGTGKHRYVWLLYKQNGRIDPNRLESLKSNRDNFPFNKFAADNNLSVPTAGNMFLTKA